MFKRLLFLFTIIAFFSLISFNKVYSEDYHKPTQMDPKVTYRIKTINDEEYIGKFLDQDSLVMRIQNDKKLIITIPNKQILRIYPLESATATGKNNWFENPHSILYYSSPSAFNMNKGEFYYQNQYLFINSLYYGISDHISIGAGIELLSTIINMSEGNFEPSGFISGQIGYKISDNFHIGAVATLTGMSGLTSSNSDNSFILCAVGTIGSNDNNFTVGIGESMYGGHFSKLPYLSLSGTLRLANGFSLITDNAINSDYFSSGNHLNGTYSYGFRFFGEKVAFDLGLLNNAELSRIIIIGVPYLGLGLKL